MAVGPTKEKTQGDIATDPQTSEGLSGDKEERHIWVARDSEAKNLPKDRVQLCKENHLWSGAAKQRWNGKLLGSDTVHSSQTGAASHALCSTSLHVPCFFFTLGRCLRIMSR